MPGKAIPVKPNPKKMEPSATRARLLKLGNRSKKSKGADKVGNKFIPDFRKPTGNRRRILDKINALNKGN